MLLPVALALFILVSPAIAAIDVYEFDEPADERRFRALIAELRCPKCQNQNIADSDAPLAADLRQRVYDMVREDRGTDDIVSFMTARYGDFITYRPPLKPSTWVLWFGPFTIMILVVLGLGVWVRGRRHHADTELSEQDRERLQALLGNSGEERK